MPAFFFLLDVKMDALARGFPLFSPFLPTAGWAPLRVNGFMTVELSRHTSVPLLALEGLFASASRVDEVEVSS